MLLFNDNLFTYADKRLFAFCFRKDRAKQVAVSKNDYGWLNRVVISFAFGHFVEKIEKIG